MWIVTIMFMVLGLGLGSAFAEDLTRIVRVSYVNPTTDINGFPLDNLLYSEIIATDETGKVVGKVTVARETAAGGDAVERKMVVTVPEGQETTLNFEVRSYNKSGLASLPIAKPFVVRGTQPSAPTGLTIEATATMTTIITVP